MSILLALAGLALLVVGCGGDAATPDEKGVLNIALEDFKFSVDDIVLEVGQKVRIVLTNESATEDHMLTMGNGVVRPEGFADGYMEDLFDGVEVEVIGPAKRVIAGEAILTREGEVATKEGRGFMVLLEPSAESTIIEFIVPNKVGEWEFGCFEDDGDHHEKGMHGKLSIFPRGDKPEVF